MTCAGIGLGAYAVYKSNQNSDFLNPSNIETDTLDASTSITTPLIDVNIIEPIVTTSTNTRTTIRSSIGATTRYDLARAGILNSLTISDNVASLSNGSLTFARFVESLTLTDGTATLTNGSLTGATIPLTDGTISINNGSLTGAVLIQTSLLTDGTASLTGGILTNTTWAGSVIDVTVGGTGRTSMTTAFAPICAGTTPTGPFQVASTGIGNSGYVLTSNGAFTLPSFQAAGGGGSSNIIYTIVSSNYNMTGTDSFVTVIPTNCYFNSTVTIRLPDVSSTVGKALTIVRSLNTDGCLIPSVSVYGYTTCPQLITGILNTDTFVSFISTGTDWLPSTNSGYGPLVSWTALTSTTNSTRLFGLVQALTIYTSVDSGVTWTTIPTAPAVGYNCIASNANGTRIITGTYGNFLYISTDSGTTWTARGTSQYWGGVASNADGTVFAAGVSYGVMYISINSGVTWTARTTGNLQWASIAMSEDGVKMVAGASNGRLWTSNNTGTTWVSRDTANRYWICVASSSDGVKLVAAAEQELIYTSTDSGVTWIGQTGSQVLTWKWVASSSDGVKLVAVAYGNRVYISNDSGVSWTPRDINRTWTSVVISADGTKIIAATSTSGSITGQLFFICND